LRGRGHPKPRKGGEPDRVPTKYEFVDTGGEEIRVSNPDKMFFPDPKLTKLDLVLYYRDVAEGALVGLRNRPSTLYRWPNGVTDPEPFYQKRVPRSRPEWLQTATVHFPSGRSAEMLVVADLAHLLWAINLGCIDMNPWPVRKDDVDHPDELRIDLDPTPGIPYSDVCRVAPLVKEVLEEYGLSGFPKTSGKRGMHVYVRIERRWVFSEVRRAALAFAREVERRADGIATTAWWKEERHGVFVDYNQNARDRTIASVYSVRPVPDARVSTPIRWDEVDGLDPSDFTVLTVPERVRNIGEVGAGIDREVGDLTALLELADRDEHEGLSDAPWPPQFPKAPGEPTRVQPSRKKKRPPSAQ
jgi:bifunctional non-homologous end joining protein LigD